MIYQTKRKSGAVQEVAIKFFTHRGAFEREKQLYTGCEGVGLSNMMAAVTHLEANTSGELLMAPGRPFPPLIVVEVRTRFMLCLLLCLLYFWRVMYGIWYVHMHLAAKQHDCMLPCKAIFEPGTTYPTRTLS